MFKKGKEEESKAVVPSQGVEVLPRRPGDLNRMFDEFERMGEEFWRRPFPSIFSSFPSLGRPLRGEISIRTPAVDMYEEENEVVIKAELPGMSKQDVEVNLTESTLTLTYEKNKEEEIDEREYAYHERTYGKFSRSLSLPCAVKSDEGKATFNNGILEVRLPKTEEAKKRYHTVKIE